MKRIMSELTAILAVMAVFCSCTKEGEKLFRGNFSFKTSGSLTTEIIVETALDTTTSTQNSLITTEQGQMDIISLGGDDGEMMVTMNVLNGDMRCFKATAKGSILELEPAEATIKANIRNSTIAMTVTVSGTAERYDNIVIFNLKYEGEKTSETLNRTEHIRIKDSEIRCVAKLNE